MGIAAGLILVPLLWIVIGPLAGIVAGIICGFVAAMEIAPYFIEGNESNNEHGYYLYDEYGNAIGWIED